jgi:Ca2+-binding RTX toxin-like protein
MDLDDVERIRYDALGGADNVVVGDLSGTDATHVDVHLQGSSGGGDGAVDTVTANSTNGGDTIAVTSAGGIVAASGLPVTVRLFDAEATNDRLVLNAQAGDDTIDASTLAAGLVSLTVNGGLGADVLLGSATGDLFNGGDGNDTSLLGAGNDIAVWNPGDDNDTIEGQAGTDTLRFNGANVAETITVSPNGGRVLFFRDVAAVTMDLNDTEVIQFAALQGADTIVLNDLTGTDLDQLAIDLASTSGSATGDGAADALTLNASGGANTISLSGATGALLTMTGLPASVTISQFETGAGQDSLTIRALDGNDTISATGLVPHFAALTIDGGAGNDVIRSNGDGTYLGGDGDDRVFAGLTSFVEAIDGGTGVDTLDTTTWGGTYVIDLVTGATNFGGEVFTNFENLTTGAGDDTITGTGAANIIITGGGADTVSAGDGIDILNGGLGADVLRGMAGSDVYVVDNAGDIVDESIAGSDGNDIVQSSITLGSVENLVLLGTGNVNAAGNSLSNLLIGNSGSNVLNGGTAADVMRGMAGNDAYVVDNAGDIVDESIAGSSGTDSVHSLISFNLGNAVTVKGTVENLVLAGSANIHATGNGLGNLLVGNSGINILNGGGGIDTMRGMAGNDVYVVDNAGDIVDESIAGDFSVPADTITLDNAIFTALGAVGTLAASAFHIGAAAADAADRIIYNAATGALIYDTNGSAAGGATQFATLDTGLAMTNADFFVA